MEKILANPDSRYHYLEDKVKVLKEGEQIVWNLDGKVNTEEGTGK